MLRTRPVLIAGLALGLALAGCQSVADPYLFRPVAGRASRNFDASLADVADSTLLALDDQGVKPKSLVLREAAKDETVIQWDGKQVPERNTQFARFLEPCRTHQARGPDGAMRPYQTVVFHYRGTNKAGQSVVVTGYVDPKDAGSTNVVAKVGGGGDPIGGDKLIDAISGHLQATPAGPPAREPAAADPG